MAKDENLKNFIGSSTFQEEIIPIFALEIHFKINLKFSDKQIRIKLSRIFALV